MAYLLLADEHDLLLAVKLSDLLLEDLQVSVHQELLVRLAGEGRGSESGVRPAEHR